MLVVHQQLDKSVPRNCIKQYSVVILNGATAVIIDFNILGMPIAVIYTLHIL